jgi:hypothetical protein
VSIVDDFDLEIVDISDIYNPNPRGRWGSGIVGHGVDVYGDYAYLAYGPEGLVIIDVSNPDAPIEVGRYKTSDASEE